VGLGILAGACIIKNPIETAGLTKELIVNTFTALGQVFTNEENLNMPTTLSLLVVLHYLNMYRNRK
jgi:hypothetical protein